jgi:hypothetical protein
MKKEIYKYPYNATTENEIKVFLSDQICEQVVSITYINGRILCTIKDRITSNKKEVTVSAAIIFGALFGMPTEAQSIGVPPKLSSAPEISRQAPQHFYQHAPTVNRRVDKIIMSTNYKIIPLVYINGHYSYINEQLLKKLRAGDLASNITLVVISVVVCAMFQLVGVDAFQIIANRNAPQPHPSPTVFVQGPSSSSTQLSVIPTEAQKFNEMSLKFNKTQRYVMTKQKALELLAETYPGEMKVTANERITDWQAAKHLYHAKGLGVDPEIYGITQKELMEMGKPGGLPEYVRKGHKLPSLEHVKAYQEALKNICENSQKRTNSKYYYRHGVTPATVYYDEDNRLIVSFNQTTGDLITGDRQRKNVFYRFMDDNTLGGLQWIAKWGNN